MNLQAHKPSPQKSPPELSCELPGSRVAGGPNGRRPRGGLRRACGWVVAVVLGVGCSGRAPEVAPGVPSGPDLAARAPLAGAGEPAVDRLLRRLAEDDGSPCVPERVGELFELASLLTTRDRALATPERAQPTARLALRALADCSGGSRGTALAVIGALAATWPAAQQALYDGGAAAQLRSLLAEEVAERRRGQALLALGALFPLHERAAPAAAAPAVALDRALLRAGLRDESRFVRRQAILAAALARDEALDGPLLAALRLQLAPDSAAVPAPAQAEPAGPADPTTLRIPPSLTPAQAAELLPLLPAFVDLLLSLPPPAAPVAVDKALQLTQAAAAASPRSATAQFLLAQVQSRRRDPAAVATLRTALALGNLPEVFLRALGPDGQALATAIDVPAARRQVRASLAARPRQPPSAELAERVTAAELSSGQARVSVVEPAALAAQAAALLRGSGPDSPAARALGAELFAHYPFGSQEYYDSCLRSFLHGNNRDLVEALGLSAERAPNGGRQLVGVVESRGPDAAAGEASPPGVPTAPAPGRYGVTCALCHAQVDAQGVRHDGLPSRTYDQGLLLAACVEQPIHEKSGNRNLADLLDYRPGRNDSSSDGVHNPTEIPSLFGLRVGGPVRWNGDTPTLEVQIDRNLSSHSAPPAVIALVAAYLRDLPLPPARPPVPGTAATVAAGAAVFKRTCQRCHAPPAYTTGEVIAQPELLTDVTRVSAVLPNSSPGYKVPSLLRVSRSAPYLHDGSIPTLEALLELPRPSRLRKPETSGHRFGLSLPVGERAALLAFLRTL